MRYTTALLAVVFVALFLANHTHAQGDRDWFRFDPPADEFADDALLDLRRMRPGRAGSEGHIEVRGNSLFCSGSGRQMRFLSVNSPAPWRGTWGSPGERAYLARRWAKLGVNHVRIGPVRGTHKLTDENLDGMFELFAECAEQGIYSGLWFYFPLEVRMPEIPGYEKKAPGQLVFFHPKARELYLGWLKKIMTTENPHTGMTLAQDPALAMVELINEDGLFFYTFAPSKMDKPIRNMLYKQFGDWLKERYGSLQKAQRAWGQGAALKEDAPGEGRMVVYDAFMYMDADWARQQRDPQRAADSLSFTVHLQRQFFAEMKAKLRSWGYKGTVIGTNWKTTNPMLLDAVEKYANMTADVMDRHAYFGAPMQQKRRKWLVNKGDIFTAASQLTVPNSLMRGVQYSGFPQFLSEHFYTAPNPYRAEMVWLGAHYAQMTGVDGFSINEFHTADWPDKPMKKFDAYTPVAVGQYPAAAYVYRAQALQEAEPVLTITRTPEQLYQLEGTPVWDNMNLDEMRKVEVMGEDEGPRSAMTPEAWFTGPVHIRINDEPAPPRAADVDQWIDRDAKVVRSRTGELSWNWGEGVAVADTARAQTACGFLGAAGPVELKQATVRMENEYGAVWLVSMDGRPVADSDRLLLQVMTRQRVGGRVVEPARFEKDGRELEGWRILDTGKGPMEVEVVRGRVSLKRPDADALDVVALDFNGYEREVLPGTAASIDLLPDCLYYVIRRK